MDEDRTAERRREAACAIHDRLRREAAEERNGFADAGDVIEHNYRSVLNTMTTPLARVWR